MTKEIILQHVRDFSPEDLVEAIRDGIVSMGELCTQTGGQFSRDMRKKVEELLNATTTPSEPEQPVDDMDDADWEEAQKENTREAYLGYKRNHPDGKHREEANDAMDSLGHVQQQSSNSWGKVLDLANLKKDIAQKGISEQLIKEYATGAGKVTHSELLQLFEADNNLFSIPLVREFFDPDDLRSIGIEEDFIEKVIDPPEELDIPIITDPLSIDYQCTELYFWGKSSSGKSCMMSSILSLLNQGGLPGVSWQQIPSCLGYDYMGKLAEVFHKNGVDVLLPGNPQETAYDMSFEITQVDSKGKKTRHPYTMIDLPGSVLFNIHNWYANKSAMSSSDVEYLNRVNEAVTGRTDTNRKMHFFVIEYGGHDWKMNGTSQNQLLIDTMNYIRDQKLFNKATDGVYILVTKADKTHLRHAELQNEISNYIQSYYGGFYDSLRQICHENAIKAFMVIPYSIGDVKMKRLCKFNPHPAETVLQIIMERAFSERKGILGALKKGASK